MFIKSQESKSIHVPEHYALALTDFTIAKGTCLHSPPQYSGSKFFFSHSFIP